MGGKGPRPRSGENSRSRQTSCRLPDASRRNRQDFRIARSKNKGGDPNASPVGSAREARTLPCSFCSNRVHWPFSVMALNSIDMLSTDHSRFRKAHDFVPDFSHAERRTRIVISITAAMMVIEITVGLMSHSMALLADGWHMSTHVIAFLITAVAYYLARRHASNVRFSFGTGKIGVLGGFASAVVLSVVALLMAGESVRRLFAPLTIHFNEAIGIACLGLAVNLGCAFLLGDGHRHRGAHHHDLNLRAAYLHVL